MVLTDPKAVGSAPWMANIIHSNNPVSMARAGCVQRGRCFASLNVIVGALYLSGALIHRSPDPREALSPVTRAVMIWAVLTDYGERNSRMTSLFAVVSVRGMPQDARYGYAEQGYTLDEN